MGRAKSGNASVTTSAPRRAQNAIELPVFDPDEEWFQPDPSVRLEAQQVARALDCDEVIAMRLVMLGRNPQEITDFLNPGPQHILPPDETVPGMQAAADDVAAAVNNGDTIAVYADYDVDGQTSLAILTDTLEQYGATIFSGSANAVSGFGLNREFVEAAHDAGATHLVTVDCGSTQSDPVRLAQSYGMQVTVIDHHDVDADNPAEHHLNPRIRAQEALNELAYIVQNHDESRQKHWVPGVPYSESLARLSQRTQELLVRELGKQELEALLPDTMDIDPAAQTALQDAMGADRYAAIMGTDGQMSPDQKLELEKELGQNHLERTMSTVDRYGHPSNTGSMLTWKFAAALHLAEGHEETPSEQWGSPLYLAGLGAIADMAPADNQEVRAFVRTATDPHLQHDYFDNQHVVPEGINMLADALGEDPTRPDELIRTRALLNLPKRTAHINPEDVQTLLRSRNRSELEVLVPRMVADYERLSAIRRDRMDPAAEAQVEASRAAGQDTYFNYAALEGFEEYSGYARMVANNLTRKHDRPAIVFTRKGVDEYGQELWKFSGANDCVPEAKLGDLIPKLQDTCTVKMKDWLGNDSEIPNVGGHVEVVSGVCTTDRIEDVKRVCEAWAGELEKKRKWRPIERKRPRVAKRKVSPQRFRRLEREALMLAPLKFPESPAVQVSVLANFKNVKVDPDRGPNAFSAMMELDDGTQRRVSVSENVANIVRAHRQQQFESIIALGRGGRPFISTIVAA